MSHKDNEPTRSTTQRGFGTYLEFKNSRNESVMVRQSSEMGEPRVWLGVKDPDIHHPDRRNGHATMSLTIADATRVVSGLRAWIEDNKLRERPRAAQEVVDRLTEIMELERPTATGASKILDVLLKDIEINPRHPIFVWNPCKPVVLGAIGEEPNSSTLVIGGLSEEATAEILAVVRRHQVGK